MQNHTYVRDIDFNWNLIKKGPWQLYKWSLKPLQIYHWLHVYLYFICLSKHLYTSSSI